MSLTITLLAGVGLFLLAYALLSVSAELLTGLASFLKRRFQPAAVRRLTDLVQEQVSMNSTQRVRPVEKTTHLTPRMVLSALTLWRPAWIAAGLLLALLFADPLLSPLALVLVLVGGELYRSTRRSKRLQRLNEDAGSLIVQFSSRYPINRSVVKTLEDTLTSLPSGEVRSSVEASLSRLRLNQETAPAVEPLQRLGYPALDRFARLIVTVQDTNQEVFLKTLEILRNEVEGRMDLQRQARQSLTLLRGTARILQGVAAAAALVVCLLPNWRAYFAAGVRTWLLYVAMLGVAALGSLYVETEQRLLEV